MDDLRVAAVAGCVAEPCGRSVRRTLLLPTLDLACFLSRPIPVVLIWSASISPGDRVLGLSGLVFRQIQQSLGPDMLGCQDRQPSDDQEDPGARSHHHDDARQEQEEPCRGHGDSPAAPGDEPQNHPEGEPRPVCDPIERMTRTKLTNGSVGVRCRARPSRGFGSRLRRRRRRRRRDLQPPPRGTAAHRRRSARTPGRGTARARRSGHTTRRRRASRGVESEMTDSGFQPRQRCLRYRYVARNS